MGNFDFRTCMHVHVFAEGWISYFDIHVFVEFSQDIFLKIEKIDYKMSMPVGSVLRHIFFLFP